MSEKIMSVDNEFFKGVDFGDMDKLDVIFAMQEKFDQDVIKNRGLQDVTPEQWIQKQTLAMLSELAELIAEVNFKWWKNPKPVDIGNVREELVDILHFFVGMSTSSSLTLPMRSWWTYFTFSWGCATVREWAARSFLRAT